MAALCDIIPHAACLFTSEQHPYITHSCPCSCIATHFCYVTKETLLISPSRVLIYCKRVLLAPFFYEFLILYLITHDV